MRKIRMFESYLGDDIEELSTPGQMFDTKLDKHGS